MQTVDILKSFMNKLLQTICIFHVFWFKWLLSIMSDFYCGLTFGECLQCFDAVGWAAGRASGLKKIEWWDAGLVMCLGQVGQGADLHMAQLMPLPFTISCSSKSRLVLPSWLCVCVCVCACMRACMHACMRMCMHACVRACLRACVRACMHDVWWLMGLLYLSAKP